MKSVLYLITVICLSIGLFASSIQASDTEVNFSEHIAPIVFNNCTSCHRPNEAAPFSLINYRDVQKRGELIMTVIEDRYMPPWHAYSKNYVFQDHRGLSQSEIGLMAKWMDNGMAEGDPSKMPEMPKFTEGWQLGEPDLVVSMKEGFTLYAEGADIYRNFVIPLNLDEDKWIKAIEFRPGKRTVVHHSLFYFDTSGDARRRDEADPITGYKTMGGTNQGTGSLGGWAVGGIPKLLPEGLAFRLPKESDFILSTHFHPSGKEETEVSTVGFYFSDETPTQRFTRLQLPPAFGALAGVNIPPGDPNYTKKDLFELPVDVKAFAVNAHAHYLGKSMKMTATLPDGEVTELLTISDWDFSWQEQYRYEDYVFLPAGTRIDATVVWDNSEDNIHNPNNPPIRVHWGRESGDEMGSVTLSIVPANPDEFDQLRTAIRTHTYVGQTRAKIQRTRNNANRTGNLGEGQIQQLIKKFDKDGDGKLSREERKAARTAFGR